MIYNYNLVTNMVLTACESELIWPSDEVSLALSELSIRNGFLLESDTVGASRSKLSTKSAVQSPTGTPRGFSLCARSGLILVLAVGATHIKLRRE